MKLKSFITVAFVILSLHVKAQFAGGDGSAGNPYLIETAQQLDEIRNYLNAENHFLLKNDIDLTDWIANHEKEDIRENGWMPISISGGNSTPRYIHGGGHLIKGLYINRPDMESVGLFGGVLNLNNVSSI